MAFRKEVNHDSRFRATYTAAMEGITRRRMLEVLGVAGAGIVVGGEALAATRPHPAGIATTAQQHLQFAAFDVTAASRKDLRDLMRSWSAAAGQRGSGLTITFGLGPGLFDPGRFGLGGARPRALAALPAFPGDALDPARSGGDLAVQACADDPGAALHAVEALAAKASGAASIRWAQDGSIHNPGGRTPRNLMGFKDGTNNIAGDDGSAMSYDVWVRSPGWMRGGSYLVVRRIRMKLDIWNATPIHGQERVIGRRKQSGAPLGGRHEFDPVDLNAGVASGNPVIPTDAHIRLASPDANGGVRIRRRSYNTGDGLLFIAFQRHPRQFVAIQRRLGRRDDALGNFIVHEGSAVFACPPGARRGGFVGDGLL
jgi:deferrochelatase/peroxidase EfeB